MARTIPMMAALAVLLAGAPALAHNHEKSEAPAATAAEPNAGHEGHAEAAPPADEAAHCQHHGEHRCSGMPPDFAALDTNSDGQIDKAELPEGHRMAGEHFDMMDKDKDGKVSKAEFEAMHAGHDGHH